jgi:DNA-binding NarL/FixJ family response regulator
MNRGLIRILLIDDHAVLRAGLASLLGSEADMTVVGQAQEGEEGLQLWAKLRPDIGLVDLSMGGIDGVETVRRIRVHDRDARLVMLTSSEAAHDASRSLEAGAAAFVTKTIGHDGMLDVIRQVHAGKRDIRLVVRSHLAPVPTPLLTARELEVLGYLRQGLTNGQIARRLGVVERTVKAHVTGILEKLQATDRAGAVARGFDLGILRVSPAARARDNASG